MVDWLIAETLVGLDVAAPAAGAAATAATTASRSS